MLGTATHRWVLPLGWIWNKAGSLLRALCKILRGALGLDPSDQIISLNHSEMRKKSHLAPQTQEQVGFPFWFCYLMWSPRWRTLSPSSQAGQNIQDFNPLSSRTVSTHLSQRIHCGEQNPFVLQNGLQNPLSRGRAREQRQLRGTVGHWESSAATGALQRKQEQLLTTAGHGKWAGCAACPFSCAQFASFYCELVAGPWRGHNIGPSILFVLFWDTAQHSLTCSALTTKNLWRLLEEPREQCSS